MSHPLFPDLGTADTLRATKGSAPLRVNSHIHLPPNFSAFTSVAQTLALADAQDVRVLGASNYYDYTVYTDFAKQAAAHGIFPLFGLEIISLEPQLRDAGVKINDPGNPGRFYLCGKGITHFAPLTAEAATLLEVIRRSDRARMAAMIDLLEAQFASVGAATGLTEEAIKAQIVARHGCPPETVFLQERHLAQAFQEALFAQSECSEALEKLCGTAIAATDAAGVQNALRSHLMKAGKPAYAPENFVDFDHAYRLILALGGVPVYPTLADGASPLCGFEEDPDRLVEELKRRGIYAAELIPIRNSPEVLTRFVTAYREAGIIVTAGTEHNTPELLALEPTCKKGVPIPEPLQAIFWEGACVLAAHQYLTARGEEGYTAQPSTEARIADFAHLGAAVIRQYRS